MRRTHRDFCYDPEAIERNLLIETRSLPVSLAVTLTALPSMSLLPVAPFFLHPSNFATDLRSRRRGRTLQQTARGDCDGQTLATPSKIKPAAVAGFAKLSDDVLKRHLGGGLTIDSDDLVTGLERCFRSW